MANQEPKERPKVRWWKPHTWVMAGATSLAEGGARVAEIAVTGVTAYPKALIHGIKASQAQFAAASDYEKTVYRWTTAMWFVVIALCALLMLLVKTWFSGLIVLVFAGLFFFRNKYDIIRAQVVAFYPVENQEDVNPLTFEIAAIRIEQVEMMIRNWRALSKAERIASSATLYGRILEVLSRDLPEGGSDSNPEDEPASMDSGIAPGGVDSEDSR